MKNQLITLFLTVVFLLVPVYAKSFEIIGGAGVNVIDYDKLPPTTLLAGRNVPGGMVTKVDLATFTEGDSITLSLNGNLTSGVIDRGNKLAYYCNSTVSAQIYISKVDLTTFTETAILQLDADDQSCADMVIDVNNQLLYVTVTYINIGVVKIDLDTFTKVDSLLVNTYAPQKLLLDSTGTYLYVSTFSRIRRIKTSDMSVVASISFGSSGTGNDMIIAGNYIYFGYGGGGYYGPRIAKINLTSFTVEDTINSVGCGGTVESTRPAELDEANGFMYWFNSVTNSIYDTYFSLGKVDIATFTGVDCIDLSTSRVGYDAADIDVYSVRGHAIYGGTSNSPCIVVKYDLESFTEEKKHTLNNVSSAACNSILLY